VNAQWHKMSCTFCVPAVTNQQDVTDLLSAGDYHSIVRMKPDTLCMTAAMESGCLKLCGLVYDRQKHTYSDMAIFDYVDSATCCGYDKVVWWWIDDIGVSYPSMHLFLTSCTARHISLIEEVLARYPYIATPGIYCENGIRLSGYDDKVVACILNSPYIRSCSFKDDIKSACDKCNGDFLKAIYKYMYGAEAASGWMVTQTWAQALDLIHHWLANTSK
jgi:hypothetical protein